MKHRIDEADARIVAYRAFMAGDPAKCAHGLPGGHVVRPWCGSPGCPLCRRGPRMVWQSIERATQKPPAWL